MNKSFIFAQAHKNTASLRETANRKDENFNYRATFSEQLKRMHAQKKELSKKRISTPAKNYLGGRMTASQKATLLDIKAKSGMYFVGTYRETLSNVEAQILIERNSKRVV